MQNKYIINKQNSNNNRWRRYFIGKPAECSLALRVCVCVREREREKESEREKENPPKQPAFEDLVF